MISHKNFFLLHNVNDAIYCAQRNIHNIPAEIVMKKLETYESLHDDPELIHIHKYIYTPIIPNDL